MFIKKIAISFFFLAAVIFAFHQSIIQWSIEWYLSKAAASSGFELHYAGVQAKPNQLIFNHPQLVMGEGGRVEASTVSIGYAVRPLDGQIAFEVNLVLPEVEVYGSKETFENIVSKIRSSHSSWLKIQLHIKSSEGKLKVFEGGNEHLFSFEIDHCPNKCSFYSVASDEGHLKVQIDDLAGKIDAKNFPMHALNALMQIFKTPWMLISGTLDGEFIFEKQEEWAARADGRLELKDIVLQHKKTNIKAKAESIEINASSLGNFIAAVNFSKGSLSFADTGQYGVMRGLKGNIVFDRSFQLQINAEGIWSAGNEDSLAVFEAGLDLKNVEEAFIGIKLDPLKKSIKSSSVQASIKNPFNDPFLNFKFQNIRQNEFLFLQRILDNIYPQVSPFRYVSGILNGALSVQMKENALSSVSVHEMDIKDSFIVIKPLEIALGGELIAGDFSFDLQAPSFQESVNAEIKVKNGKLALTGANNGLWDFTHIETSLQIQKGALNPSTASVQLAGLKGNAEIFKDKAKGILQLSFMGKGEDIKPFVPKRIQDGIDLTLNKDEISLAVTVKRNGDSIDVEGVAKSDSKNGIDSPSIPFRFSVERQGPLKIQNGHFKAEGLSLEKFVDPFLFPDRELELSGLADIEGSFDETQVTFRYGGKNVQLKNDRLMIEIAEIPHNRSFHTFCFASDANYGMIPLANGTYFDKASGLLFTDIKATAVLCGRKIHFQDLEAFSNNLYFFGQGDIDYSSDEKGAYTVNLHAENVEGSFSSVQQFFEHFDRPFFFTKIPLDGILSTGPSGIDISFNIRDEDYDVSARVDAAFSEGKILFPSQSLALHELSWNFLFDQKKNTLAFTDIQGMVLLGKEDNIDEYSLHGNDVVFTDLANNASTFDLLIKDAIHEFVRIKGRTFGNENMVNFDFDLKNTHFGDFKPETLLLVLNNWSQIDRLKMESGFDLAKLKTDLDRFGSSEVFWISKKNLEAFKNIEAKGDFQTVLEYSGDSGIFEFNIQGKDVLFNEFVFQELNLNGYNRDDRWFIEQLQLDQLSLAAELIAQKNGIKVDFFGLRYLDVLTLGLEGSYPFDKDEISWKINLFELDLSRLNQWEKFPSLFAAFNLKGKIKGSGDILFKKQEPFKFETSLVAALNGVEIQGIKFSDGSPCEFYYNFGEKARLRGLKTGISRFGEPGKIEVNCDEIAYEFQDEALKILGFKFNIDREMLPGTARTLHRFFPRFFDAKNAEQMGAVKKTGSLKGELDLQNSLLDRNFHLKLEDGNYFLFEEERPLKNITFDFQQDELKISSLYSLQRHPVWISLRMNPQHPNKGSILLADATLELIDYPALEVAWRQDPANGIVIEKAAGFLTGLHINLEGNKVRPTDSDYFRLTGTVGIDGKQVRPLLSNGLLEAQEALELGRGYALQGEFEFSKNQISDVRFFGMLKGGNVELKGYQFDQLSAQVILGPSSCQFLNCTLSDLAGTLHIGNIRMDKQRDDSWKMLIPLLTVHDLRPSILQAEGGLRQEKKPLVIRQMELENIQGILGDASSFTAKGELQFINPQKKYIQNVLFAIPSEILTRIGLNLSVLTPVSGTVEFDLKNGLFVLNKFKDVYSEGKISKFYLSNSGHPSTVNLDGSVDMQVRLRQSTLLLKLVEMFTITVKGHLSDPKYSLQRQKYLKKEEIFSSEIAEREYE